MHAYTHTHSNLIAINALRCCRLMTTNGMKWNDRENVWQKESAQKKTSWKIFHIYIHWDAITFYWKSIWACYCSNKVLILRLFISSSSSSVSLALVLIVDILVSSLHFIASYYNNFFFLSRLPFTRGTAIVLKLFRQQIPSNSFECFGEYVCINRPLIMGMCM